MSNQKSRLTRDFIRQVVKFYNEQEITITKLHTCRVCGNKWVADLEKTTCPKCSEKEIIIRNEQPTRTE